MRSLALLLPPLLATTSLTQHVSRCGVTDAPDELKILITDDAEDIINKDTGNLTSFVVDTYIHIITSKTKVDKYPLSMIDEQLKVMNEIYETSGFTFNIKSIDYHTNDSWAACEGPYCMPDFMPTMRKGSYSDLNLYFLSDMGTFLLGICSLPVKHPESIRELDGCLVSADTMPGGESTNYTMGYTAVHETGHWLGLFHTFQGINCSGDGDFVSDTPQQKLPTIGCPVKADTCPGQPGLDPIHNYMDYSNDECLTEFTKLQSVRMLWMYANRRFGK